MCVWRVGCCPALLYTILQPNHSCAATQYACTLACALSLSCNTAACFLKKKCGSFKSDKYRIGNRVFASSHSLVSLGHAAGSTVFHLVGNTHATIWWCFRSPLCRNPENSEGFTNLTNSSTSVRPDFQTSNAVSFPTDRGYTAYPTKTGPLITRQAGFALLCCASLSILSLTGQ